MARRIKKGQGITEREQTQYDLDNPADVTALRDVLRAWSGDWNAKANDFERVIGWLDGSIEAVLSGDTPDGDDSAKDFSRRIKAHLDIARDRIERGDAIGAARFAYEVGRLVEVVRMKGQWEAHALRGRKTHQAAKKGHAATYGTEQERAGRHAEYQRAVDEIHGRNSRLSYQAIRQRVAAQYGVSDSTIKRHTTNPHRK